ncbi:MAG TPA: LysM peptidoglycan-binding domain-containing protein [Planctomycetota bacterium]|nr:LysM peptidoglycan-binding domain-containing protein [Planctomycetota bacterium]
MKRNESILVYSVTGLLVVILAVAILFGNEPGVQAQTRTSVRALEDLAGVATATEEEAARAVSTTTPEGVAPPVAPLDEGIIPEPVTVPEPDPAARTPRVVPLVADGGQPTAPDDEPVSPPASAPQQPDPATQVLVLLGDSVRDGDYRIVTVRRNDTFSELVQRWCGSLDALEIAESLNEELNLQRLEEGTKVCLPWVDDAELLAAHLARKQRQEKESKVIQQARSKGRQYTVKPGDKLWNIAVRAVGPKNAAKYIEQVKALNPELLADPSKLVAGKTIYLPD